MQVNFEELKALIEAGDKSAFIQHIFKSLEKGDILTAVTTNAAVKSDLDSEKDKHHHTALETWKSNNLEAMVEAELTKRNPQETEEQKRIAALEKELESQKKAAQKEKLMNIAMKQATDKGLPTDIVNFFLAEDEESTTANLGRFEEVYTKAVQAAVENKFKENGRDVNKGFSGSSNDGDYGKEIAKEFNGNVEGAVKAQENYFG
ncbi:DUF4355 domain-containing protein [Metabacillus fastidiosus]|uniref:DUF4355 domain-containing protein n=1 Tax=Metabacillus fastidiosus TaxID=1458 RepID=UPI000825DBA4|nr:DUF4355 domain-containing protein [Metabacillus fastidiosus]MED4461854.1 DUF4355 domain-containing protein [Metabacillus fastidiosus]